MRNVKILDCTLRDGGYVNNWEFSSSEIISIVSLLNSANIDYIEAGFVQKSYNPTKGTLFYSFSELNKQFLNTKFVDKLVVMVKADKLPQKNIPNSKNSIIKTIRLIFKKNYLQYGLEYAKMLIDKGYRVFINPTFCTNYTSDELINLACEINKINPFAYSVVDSLGSLSPLQAKEMFDIFDKNLNQNITLCFHYHNNMQLSYQNAIEILKQNTQRDIIIDSTVFGIGRGAGNLQTELIMNYLNKNFDTNYDILPIFEIVKKHILPIKMYSKWGSSIPYFLSAINKCHPYYGRFLDTNAKINAFKINSILKSIPKDKKIYYDSSCISTLFSLMMK